MNHAVQVPYQSLNPDTLRILVEDFVTREGTDYGDQEISLESKVQQVIGQLRLGAARIVYDGDTESCTISKT